MDLTGVIVVQPTLLERCCRTGVTNEIFISCDSLREYCSSKHFDQLSTLHVASSLQIKIKVL
jgi:hypothetical protein